MREHLFGEKSPLFRHKLVEGTRGEFGESIRLTQLGIKALLGKQSGSCSSQELKTRVMKNTLFDLRSRISKRTRSCFPPRSWKLFIPSYSASHSRAGIRRGWQLITSGSMGLTNRQYGFALWSPRHRKNFNGTDDRIRTSSTTSQGRRITGIELLGG